MRKVFLIFLLLFSQTSLAGDLFFSAAGMAAKYPEEDMTWGISFRGHFTFYESGSGFFGDLYAPGGNLINYMYSIGYSFRSNGSTFFEYGAGGAYSITDGPGLVALVGLGHRFSGDFSFFFPLYYRTGGHPGFEFSPYIGWRF